ncbi:hypothetical protein [Streptosporangium sp. NPDC006930]|uniref:hypothetical protein n=1 Tax=Streptosporangium sp. NPDC006930 TaxID=3154783 RepID=UPI003437D3C9
MSRPEPSAWAGLRAVARLLLTAVDDFLAAVAGTRPIRYNVADFAQVVGDAYRTGKNHVHEGDVIDGQEDEL